MLVLLASPSFRRQASAQPAAATTAFRANQPRRTLRTTGGNLRDVLMRTLWPAPGPLPRGHRGAVVLCIRGRSRARQSLLPRVRPPPRSPGPPKVRQRSDGGGKPPTAVVP